MLLWLSADHSTPFSHLLSLVSAWGLAALFITVFYAVTRKSISELKLKFESHKLSLKQIIKTQIPQVCMLITLVFGLASQNVSQTLTYAFPDLNENSLASDSLLSEAKLEQAWVYTLDPLSKKRARIGRWSDLKDAHFIKPYSKVTEKHLSGQGIEQIGPTAILDKDKKAKVPTKSRLRLRITGGDFRVTREQACSGSSVYHVQPIGGTVDLSVFQTRDTNSFISYSMFKIKSSGESVDEGEVETFDGSRFVHSAQFKVEGKFFNGGLGFSHNGSEDAVFPIFHAGAGFNTLTPTKGSKIAFEAGFGSGLDDFFPSEIIGLYLAIKTRHRLGLNKDLVINVSKPMLFTGENVFVGTGFKFHQAEFVLQTNIDSEYGVMPALASLQFGF